MDDLLIPGFDVLGKIGDGATATVWKARQLSLDRIVAIKVLRPEYAANPAEIEQFVNEARRAAGLKHPNIVQIYDASDLDGLPYFVMECVDGASIADSLEAGRPLSAQHCISATFGVASALSHAWQQMKIIHRDVKPANILFDRDGTVKLSDLGLAMQIQPGGQRSGLIEGTPGYMSPEQIEGEANLSPRTDMYSLGASLYHMSTGTPPFSGDSYHDIMQSQILDRITNPRDLNPDLPVGLMQLITLLMMRSADDRHADWNAALRDIQIVSKRRLLVASMPDDPSNTLLPAVRPSSSRSISPGLRAPSLIVWALVVCWWAWLTWALVNPNAGSTGDAFSPSEGSEPDNGPPARGAAIPVYDAEATTAKWLVRGETTRASRTLRELSDRATDVDDRRAIMEMEVIVEQLTASKKLIADALRRRVGKTITITHLGKQRQLTLVQVDAGSVVATQAYEKDGVTSERDITFDVSILGPAERARWLSVQHGPAEACLKFILLFRAGDRARANDVAARCGPFAAAFRRMTAANGDPTTP